MTNNDWREPIHPLRIWINDTKYHRCHPVIAIRFQDRALEYMTVNGMFIASSDIAFAEYFVNGDWSTIKALKRFQAAES